MKRSKTRNAKHWLLASLILSVVLTFSKTGEAQVAGSQINASLILQAPYSPYLDQVNKRTIITLTNVSGRDMTVALKGKIFNGDKFIATRDDVYSDEIILSAGQTKVLNNTNFNYGSFLGRNVVDDNMTDADINSIYNDRVIPEGNYTYCIDVYEVLRGDHFPVIVNGNPNGESLCISFSLVFAQPPKLINPFDNTRIDTKSPVSFSWTQPMPVTSQRDLRYDLYIVKTSEGEDPRTGMENAFTYQSNYFVKIPDLKTNVYTFIPQTNAFKLEPGQRYAVMVQAKDEKGKTFFQNDGKSEITSFVYGAPENKKEEEAIVTKETKTKKSDGDNLATNKIKGRLLWAFRENEDAYKGSKATLLKAKEMTSEDVKSLNKQPNSLAGSIWTPQGGSLSKTGGISVYQTGSIYGGYNPLTDNKKNAEKAVGKDPTIFSYAKANGDYAFKGEAVFNTPPGKKSPGEGNVFAGGADKVEYGEDAGSKKPAAKRMPLANVTVKVSGIPDDPPAKNTPKPSPAQAQQTKNAQASQWLGVTKVSGSIVVQPNAPTGISKKNEEVVSNLIATGTTDSDGFFTLSYTSPDYTAIKKYKKVEISWAGEDFINNSMVVSTDVLLAAEADLGEIVAIANTYRFTPTIKAESYKPGKNETSKLFVGIYREEADLVKRPYLNWEGSTSPEGKKPKIMFSKKVVPVFEDSITYNGLTELMLSRLFYKGRLYIEISSGKKGLYEELKTDLVVNPTSMAPDYVLNIKPTYLLLNVPPFIYGNVKLVDNNISPVGGAVISVEFDKKDVEESYIELTSPLLNAGIQTYSKSPTKQVTATQQANFGIKNNVNISSSPLDFYNSDKTAGGAKGGGLGKAALNKGDIKADQSKSLSDLFDQTVGPYSTTTDEEGNYFIGNLPKLKPGAKYIVKLIKAGYFFTDLKPDNNDVEVPALKRGESKLVDFTFHPELFQVVGRVVAADSVTPIANARLHFFNSTTYFNSGEDGLFTTTYMKGKYSLIIEKEGYLDRTVEVVIEDKKETKADTKKAAPATGAGKIAEQILASNTVQASINRGYTFTPAMFGIAGSQSSAGESKNKAEYSSYMGFTVMPGLAQATLVTESMAKMRDVGDIGYLPKKVGKIKFRILEDKTDKPVSGASISLFDATATTDSKGEWFYEGFGGKTTVRVIPAEGTGLVATEESIIVTETGNETVKVIKLSKGIKVSGIVKSNNTAVAKAEVKVEDKPYITATSDNDGRYALYLPEGTFQLRAGKTGYVADKAEVNIAQADINKDFNLGSAGNNDISQMLGFPIEVDKMVQDGNGYKLTGSFVNLQPSISGLVTKGMVNMKFTDVRVVFNSENKAIPDGGKVVTDEVSVALKLFDFIPVSLKPQGTSFVVSDQGNGKGKISGSITLDIQSLQGSKGWNLSKMAVKLLPKGTSNTDFAVFDAGSSGTPGDVVFNLSSVTNTNEWSGDIYGFKFAALLKESFIDKNGLHFKGRLNTPDLGPIKKSEFKITDFTIGTDLKVKTVKLDQTGLPTIDIAGWKASIASLLFNENGFKLGGSITVSVPKSGASSISFSDLAVGKDAMYGGKFSLPEKGINIFNIVQLKSGKSALSFGQVSGMPGVYRLAGSGKIKFDKIVTKEIEISAFEVHTNGKLLVDVPVNYSANLSIMNFELQSVQFNSTASTPYISLQGGLSVEVPLVKMSVGDIKFTPKANGGVDYSIGKISATLDVPVLKTTVDIAVKDNGFAGKGSLGIPGTPVDAGIDMHYYKVSGGIDFGASFVAGVVIPVGLVTIEKVGGGFQYNTATKDFAVTILGAVSVTGTGAAAKLDPVSLTVKSGPVIEGSGSVVVATVLKMANAKMYLDFPNRKFAVNVKVNYEPLPGLSSTQIQGDLIISGAKGDSYVFLGCNMHTNLAGLVNANGDMAIGMGIKNPMGRGDAISYYFRNADYSYIGDEFSGVYVNTVAKMGRPHDDPLGFKIFIASANIWYYTEAGVGLILNFAQNNYLLKVKGSFSGGFSFCVGYKALSACAGLGYSACYDFTGGRNNNGWFVSGEAAGKISIHIGGCDPGCNEIDWGLCGIGGRLCATGGAKVSYSQSSGLSLGIVIGGTVLCP
ncbi:MAG: carboxypeptidase-like regulatory domain-containing protein [Chitinophagales bacterium]|nr:carboxypeptidase-like regulatory domain-containing protein [Chitinophagales bacterium]